MLQLKKLGVDPIARIHSLTVIGEDPVVMLEAPINATRAALKKAREVSDNSNATQKQVDAAREALEKAIAGLVKRTAAKGDGNVVSNTGANVVTIAVAGLLLAGAGAAIAYRRNREQM